jgi:hypothetical protein
MISAKIRLVVCVAALCVCALLLSPAAFGQDASQSSRASANAPREDETNVDAQLYLILATNRDAAEGKVPAVLDPIMARLRDSLAFRHYSLAGTFLNRVTNNERLEVSWVGGPFLMPVATAIGNPSFNQFGATVSLISNRSGHEMVRMRAFRFGSKVPVVTGQSVASNAATNGGSLPMVNYESVGLLTDISMQEGSPVIAGTLNLGPSGDAIIVVILARRAAN